MMLICMLMVIQHQKTFAEHLEAHCWALGERSHVRCLALSTMTLVQRDEDRDSMPSWTQQEAICEPPVLICKPFALRRAC